MNAADGEILDHFAATRRKTMDLFQRVPDDWLTRCPDGEDMSLSWLFMHIADGPDWWMHHCMRDGRGWQYPGDGPFARADIDTALASSQERVVAFFKSASGDRMGAVYELPPEKTEGEGRWTGRNRVVYLTDHEIHHRGKIVLALRQWQMTGLPFMP